MLTPYYDELHVQDASDPNRTLTRAEFLKLVLHAIKTDMSDVEHHTDYADLDGTMWYDTYVQFASKEGFVSGDNNYFRPNDIISRGEASKIFILALGLPQVAHRSTFADVGAEDPLTPYIESAYYGCLVHGRHTIDGEPLPGQPRVFEPYDGITLGETAKILFNEIHKFD